MLRQIVSGGQTGVDRAALDAALAARMRCGGWCPKGRRAEDGTLAPRYPVIETPSDDYAQRTAWNVRDADGTLVLTFGAPTGGTAQTIDVAVGLGRPYLVVRLEDAPDLDEVRAWLRREQIRVLNVAGPRESKQPGVYARASAWLRRLLAAERAASRGSPRGSGRDEQKTRARHR